MPTNKKESQDSVKESPLALNIETLKELSGGASKQTADGRARDCSHTTGPIKVASPE